MGKNKRKQAIKDHCFDLAKIDDLLDDPSAIEYLDTQHSDEEKRRVIAGKTAV